MLHSCSSRRENRISRWRVLGRVSKHEEKKHSPRVVNPGCTQGRNVFLLEEQCGDALYMLLVCRVHFVFIGIRRFKCPSILSIILILNYHPKQLNMQNTPEEFRRNDETTFSGTLLS